MATCLIQQNLKVRDGVFDPFKAFWQSKQQGWRPIGFRAERALWRDSAVLFERHGRSGSARRPPELMEWLARIDDERLDGAIEARAVYELAAFGLATDEGKAASVVLWRREHLPLPLALLEEEGAEEAIRTAVEMAEAAGRQVTAAAVRLALLLVEPGADRPEGERTSKEAMDRAKALAGTFGLERRYWPRLEAPFGRFLEALPGDRAYDADAMDEVLGGATLPAWRAEVSSAARRAFEEGTSGLARSARSLKAVATARRQFGGRLEAALGAASEETSGDAAGAGGDRG